MGGRHGWFSGCLLSLECPAVSPISLSLSSIARCLFSSPFLRAHPLFSLSLECPLSLFPSPLLHAAFFLPFYRAPSILPSPLRGEGDAKASGEGERKPPSGGFSRVWRLSAFIRTHGSGRRGWRHGRFSGLCRLPLYQNA